MTPTVIASLLAQFGIPMVHYFVGLHQAGNAPLTPEQSAALLADIVKLNQYRSADSLAAAGIKIVDGKVVTS